jgi:hypothetical protein
LEDLGVDGRILTWFFNKWGCSEQEQVAGSCERGNEPSEFHKMQGLLDKLGICQLFKKDSNPCI